jgi:hypothetical protein
MKFIFPAIALLFVFITATKAQERIDVVYLKNGDIIKGLIIENVPGDYIRIELSGGSILTYKYVAIQKFTKEKKGEKTKENNVPPQTNIIMQQQQQQQSSQNEGSSSSVKNNKLTDAQRKIMYENQKKNPATARALSFLISSAGHAYAENWGRGLLFLLGRTAFLGVAIAGAEEQYSINHSNSERGNAQVTLGVIGFLGFAIWEIIDAGNEVEDYNERLYNSIYHNVPNFGLNISPINKICNIPVNDGIQLSVCYNF